jgi:histidine decarboxylase
MTALPGSTSDASDVLRVLLSDSPSRPRDRWRRRSAGRAALNALRGRLRNGRRHAFGYPHHAALVDFSPLERRGLFRMISNNVGDPYEENPVDSRHSKDFERALVEFFGDLFDRGANRWGCVTTGSSGAILKGLELGRERLPAAPLVFTEAAHYSVAASAHTLRMKPIQIGADECGEMDYGALAAVAQANPGPLVVLATAGTPMTEAVDRIERIRRILKDRDHYVHMDAALTGVTLALHDKWRRFIAGPHGPDSFNISGHKFFSVPTPCAMLLAQESDVRRRAVKVPYTASSHTTLEGSRDGHLPLRWWWTVHQLGGVSGLRSVSTQALHVAEYAAEQVNGIGWGAVRNPWGLTVAFKEPPDSICRSHGLARGGDGWARWIAMPGRTRSHVDALVRDLRQAA